jgi:VanZ family protein
MKKVIKWLLLIAWMIVIFMFSHQPGDVSAEKSRFVLAIFNFLGLNLDSLMGELSTFIVRKAAHFGVYFILYLLIYNVVADSFKLKTALLISLAGVFLYACTDEFHQTFIPGRSGNFKDVLIDTLGGLTACIMIYVHKIMKRTNRAIK